MHHTYEFQYCPVCGGGLKSSVLKDNEPARLICTECEFIFYQDPKLVACALVEIDNKIVLLKRGVEPEKGKWVMPGGYVDRGEEVEAAAVRETSEECGIQIRIKNLFGIYSYLGQIEAVAVYLSEHLSGELIVGDETLEVRLLKPQDIPWDNLAFQSTADALKDYCKMRSET